MALNDPEAGDTHPARSASLLASRLGPVSTRLRAAARDRLPPRAERLPSQTWGRLHSPGEG